MESSVFIDKVIDDIGAEDSDYDSSGDEWQPGRNDISDYESDEPARLTPPRKKKKRCETPGTSTARSNDSDSDDDVPLLVIRQKIFDERETFERDLDEDILTQI